MEVENRPRPSRTTVTLRILSATLAASAATSLGLVLSLGVWILAADPETPDPKPLAAAALTVITLGLVGFLLCLVCRVAAKVTLPCLILCSSLLAFLALDDLHRAPEPDFGPVAAPGSPERRAYMQMASGTPESISATIPLPQNPKDLFMLAKPEEWDALLTGHREQVLQEWETDTLGRKWLKDLATLPPDAAAIEHRRIDGPLLAFQPVRAITSRHLAYVCLLAKDGRTEESAEHLQTILRACYALERIGVGPVDEMIAVVIEKKVYAAIRYLCDHGSLTAASATSLAQVLETAPGIEFIAKRSILGDLQPQRDITDRALTNAFWSNFSSSQKVFRKALPALSTFVLHPYRMERERIQVHTQMATFIAARQLDAAQAVSDDFVGRSRSVTSLRNPGGRKLAAMATPSIQKLGKNLWETEDARLALIKQLKITGQSTSPAPQDSP